MENPGFNIQSAVKNCVNEFLHNKGFGFIKINTMEFTEEGLDIQIEAAKKITDEEKKTIMSYIETFSEGIQAGFKLHTETFKFVLQATSGDSNLSEDDISDLLT